MKALLASISILFAFISRGNAIECEVCSDRASMDCSGELVTCDQTVESCQTAITDMTFEGLDPMYAVFKNCSDVGAKNILHRFAAKDVFYQQRVEVCQTNGCNKGPLQSAPPVQSAYHGCTNAEFAEQVPIGPADTVQEVVTLIVSKGV
uniref:Sodefrin-like factor n=1 Tax=Notophthalmus viridescens TaxID=8316 RepID=A0A0E3N6B6_NOTVI|nr:sodefrin precursor-like factor [Notophthalmus viridescens]